MDDINNPVNTNPNEVVLDSGITITIDAYNQFAKQELELKKAVENITPHKRNNILRYIDNLYEQVNRDRPDGNHEILNDFEALKNRIEENNENEFRAFIDYIDSLYPSQFGNPIKEKPEEYENEYLNVTIHEDSTSFLIFDEIAKILNRNPIYQQTGAAQAVHMLSGSASRNSNNAQAIVDYLHNPNPAGRQNMINVIISNVTKKNQDINTIALTFASTNPTYVQPIQAISQENQKVDTEKFSAFVNYIDFKVSHGPAIPIIDQTVKNDALSLFGSFFRKS